MYRKEGVGRQGKRLFYFGDFSRYSPGGAGRRLYTPPVETPAHSAPGTTAHDREQRRPCQMQGRPRRTPAHTPGRWARCTGLHSIPDRPRRVDRTGGGRWRAGSVSGKVYNFGRLFLSIFIWIYFAESIDNPYLYGYNIISPDKYGLQPQYTKTGGQNHEDKKNHARY